MAGDIIKLRDMRTGKPPHKTITLGNGDESMRVAVVLLSADAMLNINEKVDSRYGSDKSGNKITRNQYYNILLSTQCLRSVDDINIRLVDDEDELSSLLDLEDIKRICEAYNELIVNKAPKLETLKEEDYDELKKFLEVTKLKDLNTVSLTYLKYFHQTIHS